MDKYHRGLLNLSEILTGCLPPPSPAATAHALKAEVLSVHDGDSITARRVGPVRQKPLKVRVYGIDCPELGQPYGNEAQELAARILKGNTVDIVPAQKAKSYRREVGGIVLLEDMLVIQDALFSAGLAWGDDRYCKLPVCDLWRLHQREARAAGRGLWAAPDPVSPWTWRKMQRSRHKK